MVWGLIILTKHYVLCSNDFMIAFALFFIHMYNDAHASETQVSDSFTLWHQLGLNSGEHNM